MVFLTGDVIFGFFRRCEIEMELECAMDVERRVEMGAHTGNSNFIPLIEPNSGFFRFSVLRPLSLSLVPFVLYLCCSLFLCFSLSICFLLAR